MLRPHRPLRRAPACRPGSRLGHPGPASPSRRLPRLRRRTPEPARPGPHSLVMPESPREMTFDDLRAQLAAPAPSLAGASAAALTAAMAAALVTMIGQASRDWPQGEQT